MQHRKPKQDAESDAEALLRKHLPIIYEDELLVAVAKPAGIDVGRTPGQEAPGVIELLSKARGEHLLVCNRLSRYDSCASPIPASNGFTEKPG